MAALPNKARNGYQIKMLADNSAEINMYGEVVSTHPRDWWTGELVPGNFIATDVFLEDLENLKDKDTITVHINSGGGELDAGVSIYNRLKELPAKITTVNDALAASAASLIFQAGDVRKMHSGSTVMVHQAACFTYGYYQINDFNTEIKRLEAGDKQALNIYAEASGRDADEIKALVDAETWMVGQEAVDEGLADEIISDEDDEEDIFMGITRDKKFIVSNSVYIPTRGMMHIPEGLPISNIVPKVVEQTTGKSNSEGSKEDMEINNAEELQEAYPEFVKQIADKARAEGREKGVADERARLQGIEAIENAVADKEMLQDAKYGEKPMGAADLAFVAMQKQANIGAKLIDDLQNDTETSGVSDVDPEPTGGDEEKEDLKDMINLVNEYRNGGK